MGKSVYNSVDELPDLSQEEIHVADPKTKQVKTYKSVDELPDLKKKVGLNDLPPVSDNGLSNTPKVDEPKVKFSLDDYVLPSTKNKLQERNKAISTESVQPKITASYDDFVAHNQERKEKKAKLVGEAIENTARKVLKNKEVIKPEEEGKSLNLSQYQQLTTEKKRLQEAYDNGDATFAISKDGEVGLKKTIGWHEAFTKGINAALKNNDDANDFANNMTAEQKIAYLEKNPEEENKNNEYLGERPSTVGSITGMVGENAPYLAKAAVGATAGAALTALSPVTGGLTLTGLPVIGAILATSGDAINHGARDEIIRRYHQFMYENPNGDKVEAMKRAEQGYYAGGTTGFLSNMVLTGTGIKTPVGLEGKSVIGKAIEKTVKAGVHIGSVTGGLEAAKVAEGNLEGVKATPEDIAKEAANAFKDNATPAMLLTGMIMGAHGVLHLPNVVKSAFKYGLKDIPSQEISSTLKMNKEAGIISEETAKKVEDDINGYKAAVAKTPNGLSSEAEASVAGLIQAKDKLVAEMKTKDDSAKPFYDEKIAGIDEQIQKTLNTGKPYAHEIDEMSGDKYTSKPTTEPVQQEVTSTEVPKTETQVPASAEPISSGGAETSTPVLEGSDVKSEEVADVEPGKAGHGSVFSPAKRRGMVLNRKQQDLVNKIPKTTVNYKDIKGIGDLSKYLNNPEALNTPDLKSAKSIYDDIKNGKPIKDTPAVNESMDVLDGQNRIAAQLAAGIENIDVAVIDKSFYDKQNNAAKSENKPIQQNEEIKTNEVQQPTEVSGNPTEVVDTAGGKEPPKVEPTEVETNKFRDKGILNRLASAEKVPKASKKGFEEKGLKYEPQTAQEAESIGKAMVDQYGVDDAVTLAETAKFKGGVNSAIFAESLNRIFKEEQDAKTPEAKLEAAKRFAEVGIRYDEFSRGQGRDISQIGHFYKKSPLGIKLMEEARRREDFDQYAKNKEQSWKEFFNEMQKDPEFEKEFKGKVQEELKKERAEARAKRIKKVDAFFDDAINKLKNGGAAYSTFVPIPPKALGLALEGMKKAYHAGEKVAKIIEDAIAIISKEVGGGWDKEAFRKEWDGKLGEQDAKMELPADKRERILERFKKKLKGLSDKEKEDVIRKSFKKLIENGALEYADFKKIIAETLGYGEMTPEQAKKLVDLVGDINKVEDMATALRDNDRSEKGLKEYQEAKKKAEKSATELGKLVFNKPEILKRILSIMQLNTLGVPSLVNNPIFNVFNQATVRLPRSIIMSGLDYALNQGGKVFGKKIEIENNVVQAQREFYNKLRQGSAQSIEQLQTGLTNSDYFQKEVRTSQIHPVTSMKELWSFAKGETKLTGKQIADKSLQATFGVPAEIVARVLNIGDKPQRFAAEGAQAAVFAKNLGLQGVDYKLFMEFPKEEAYRAYKKQGLSDEVAMKKAEDVQSRIVREGEESTFQQDNLLNDVITGAFEALKKGGNGAYSLGQVVKTLNMPFVKIPLNAYWSVFNLANPEVALLQSITYAAKAYKTKSPIDIQQSKKWFAHAVTGLAWMGVTGALAKAGVINSGNADDTTKKEREGEQFYEQQNTINMGKLQALMQGQDPDKVKDGLLVDLKWLGNMGILMGYQAKKMENLTPEQKANGTSFMEDIGSNLTESAIDFADKGVFQNTGAMYTAISKGGRWMDGYLLNGINMITNIVQPATFAQLSRAELPYYSKAKADNFLDELNNNLLIRSSWLRDLNNEYPPSKVSIWGDQFDKKDNAAMRLFGISRQNDDNFAQPLYNDYKKTHNTKFFPSSIKPEIKEGGQRVKLTTKETQEFEQLVGQARKQLVAPYINDMANFEGSSKKYSELTDDEKIKNLEILYQVGYETGEFQFLQAHPTYKAAEKTEDQIEMEKEMELNNKQLRQAAKDKMGVE